MGFLVLSQALVGQERNANLVDGFESGMSPRLAYQSVRRLWVDVEPTSGGLLVTGLYPNSPARRMKSRDGTIPIAMLEPDDIILSIDGRATLTQQELANGIMASSQWCELVVRDRRTGKNRAWMAEPVWANMPIQRPRPRIVAEAMESPTKLYAIVVAATNDPDLGRFIEHSLAELQSCLASGIEANRIELKVLSGDDCSAAQLIQALEELSPNANDALLVYYLGHGAYDPQFAKDDPYGGHFLDLPGKDLLRKTLWDQMESTYSRLRVLITDSCNVESVADPDARFLHELRTVERSIRGSTPLEWLFLGHRGRCDVGAASKGQFAWYSRDIGGWFTNRWIATSDKSSSWTEVRDRVIPATEELYAVKKREYQAAPATTKPASIAQLAQQEKMTPQILLTRVKRDSEDPIGVNGERRFSSSVTASIREP